jgi:predicted rRNA methylase YqxC with S4 and FtsJ domains
VLLGVCENSIVGLQLILVEESLVTANGQRKLIVVLSLFTASRTKIKAGKGTIDSPNTLDVQQRVLQAQ